MEFNPTTRTFITDATDRQLPALHDVLEVSEEDAVDVLMGCSADIGKLEIDLVNLGSGEFRGNRLSTRRDELKRKIRIAEGVVSCIGDHFSRETGIQQLEDLANGSNDN